MSEKVVKLSLQQTMVCSLFHVFIGLKLSCVICRE